MNRICFVSYEIHPTTWGGAGVLLYNAARVLLEKGHEVIFLLDIPEHEFIRFQEYDRLNFPNPHNCRAYHVAKLCEDIPYHSNDFISSYAWNSFRFHFSCSKVYQLERPDIIEFFDYCGVAHYALSAKVSGLGYEDAQMVVRLHNSNEVMNINEPRTIDAEYYTQFNLEHHALRLAETVIYPSETYLYQAYKPHYPEQWFGNLIRSTPPFVDYPIKNNDVPDQNIILFLNRLYSFKGVDKFVDAAVILLSQGIANRYKFYLLGHDSMRPPTGIEGQSYKDYLIQKIPVELRDHFIFTGPLNWGEIQKLLPMVRYAVFPNYFESFCYAAHELYSASIPLIVSNIAAFQDYFQHEKNALVFDGTVEDLVDKMHCLIEDDALLKKITRPYPIADSSMSGFYEIKQRQSWISHSSSGKNISLLVCVISKQDEDSSFIQKTINQLKSCGLENARILIFRSKNDQTVDKYQSLSCLGGLYKVFDQGDNQLSPMTIKTTDALLILRPGDIPKAEFLQRSLDLLQRQPQVSFVGCWHETITSEKPQLNTFPLDAMLEIYPFQSGDPFSRCIMRTIPNHLIADLFDQRSGSYGEMQYLWNLDDGEKSGLIIPKVLITQISYFSDVIPASILSYLVTQDNYKYRKERLARYAVSQYVRWLNRNRVDNTRTKFIKEPHSITRFSFGWYLKHNIKRILQKSHFLQKILLEPMLLIWKWLKGKRFNEDHNSK